MSTLGLAAPRPLYALNSDHLLLPCVVMCTSASLEASEIYTRREELIVAMWTESRPCRILGIAFAGTSVRVAFCPRHTNH